MVLFVEGSEIYVWFYVIYIDSAALALDLTFYLSETECLGLVF